MLLTVFMAAACAPLFALFANAYLWTQHPDILLLVVFNFVQFFTIPAGFYWVGLLMRRFPARNLYAAGFVLQGGTLALLVGFKFLSYIEIALIGAVLGLPVGIYWGARHLLGLTATRNVRRDYYCSLETSVGTVCNVVMPAVFGVFIQSSFFLPGLLTQNDAYLILLLVAFVFILWSASRIVDSGLEVVAPDSLLFKEISPHWRKARGFVFCKGIANGGAIFLPALIALSEFKSRGDLGIVQSVAALCTAFCCYILGRIVSTGAHRFGVLSAGTAALVAAGAAIAISFNAVGVVIFFVLFVFGWALTWGAANPLTMNAIELDEPNPAGWYRYFCDREVLLSFGRIAGVALFLGILWIGGQHAALRYSPLAFGITQLFFLRAAWNLSQDHMKPDIEADIPVHETVP